MESSFSVCFGNRDMNVIIVDYGLYKIKFVEIFFFNFLRISFFKILCCLSFRGFVFLFEILFYIIVFFSGVK